MDKIPLANHSTMHDLNEISPERRARKQGSPAVIHALARTTVHEKVLSFLSGEGNARDRFDARATSLTNRMIRMPHKHHCLSLAGLGEARMREFDSRLASRCPYPRRVSWLVYP